jgi:hypothetical protein
MTLTPSDLTERLLDERYLRMTAVEFAINMGVSGEDANKVLDRAETLARYMMDGSRPSKPSPVETARRMFAVDQSTDGG